MRTGTVSYRLEDLKNGVIIPIGFVGENDFTRVIFDAEEVYKKHPDAQVSIKVQPPKGVIYPATMIKEGNNVIWQVKAADVANRGSGELQLTFTEGETVIKSYIARTDIKRSLEGNGPAPDPVQGWVDEATQTLADLEYKRDSGYFKGDQGEPGEPGEPGQDGHSPVLTADKVGKTTTIYADGQQLAQIQDGEDGQGGDIIDDTEPAQDKVFCSAKVDETTSQLLNAIQGIHQIPSGGSSGQVLGKASNTNYDLEWKTVSGGGVVDSSLSDSSTNPAQNKVITNEIKYIELSSIFEVAEITYGEGAVNSSGGITPASGYFYSSAIKLNKGDSLILQGFNKIYRIARYNNLPTIGTTEPNRYVNSKSTLFVEDQNEEYVVLTWDKWDSGETPTVLICRAVLNILPIVTTTQKGLMSGDDKKSFDYLFRPQAVNYYDGAVSSNGSISYVTGYRHSSAIQLTARDVLFIKGFKSIYRIARYNDNPTIGTTVPDRYVNSTSTIFTEDRESEYVVLTWDSYTGSEPEIIVYHMGDIPVASVTQNGLMSKDDKQKLNGLNNLSYDVATQSSNGLMSKQDKQKLDNIVTPGTITITGSGVTKNAAAYGFLPTNTAEDNSLALQNVVTGGGTILVDYPGTYDVCDTCILESDTTLIFGAGVYLNRTTDSNNKTAAYPFINNGSYTGDYDENISIIGLHLITNGYGVGNNGTEIYGQRGQLSFANIRNLIIRDFEILDGTNINEYNIHIQRFDNITLENIKIISQKDGIHLGAGTRFAIRHCYFMTNDDAIALNAHDYPTGTRYLGWIKNGVVEDITIARADNYNKGRGLYLLGGSWLDWESGNSYRTYGDVVVSDGKIYRSVGTISQDKPTLTSTVQPTHESGEETYSDGLTWRMCQTVDICYNSGVSDVVFRDIHIDRTSAAVMTISCDDDPYSRSYYPESDIPVFKNITLQNVFTRSGAIDYFIQAAFPVENLRVMNAIYNALQRLFVTHWSYSTGESYSSMTFDSIYFELTNDNKNLFLLYGTVQPTAKCRIGNSLGNYGEVVPVGSSYVTLLSNDVGIS